MNDLNTKLQGKNLFAFEMYTNVKAFKSKLTLFLEQLLSNSFVHFPTLVTMKEASKHVNKYSKLLDNLHQQFCRRFQDFIKLQKSFNIVSASLSRVALTAPQELQLVLIDLQSDYLLKEKFQVLKLNEFYALLNDATFPNIQKMEQRMLILFGSTYICEQTFSLMNFNKSNHKSRSTDTQLKSVLTIATTKLSPDFDTLAKKNVA